MTWARTFTDRLTDPAARLLCFPFAGAGASIYRDWQLPGDLATDLWIAQPPGRESRRDEPSATDLNDLVRAYAEHLPLQERPFALFGHSLGALIAYELTVHLRREGYPQPTHLFVSAFRAPHLPPSRPAISPLDDEALLERLLMMAGSSPSTIRDPDLLMFLAPGTRADCALIERHQFRPEPPLDLPITAFAAVDDCEVDPEEMAAWERHTTTRFRMREFVGGHLFMRDHTDTLLAEIAAGLVMTAPR